MRNDRHLNVVAVAVVVAPLGLAGWVAGCLIVADVITAFGNVIEIISRSLSL